MVLPPNPFPAQGQSIGEKLFVGRSEFINAFQAFIHEPPEDRRTSFWLVTGARGQGKTSLMDACHRIARGKPGVALGTTTWMRENPESSIVAEGLYKSILDGKSVKGGWRFGLHNLLKNFSPSYQGVKISLPSFNTRFCTGAGLMMELTDHLSDGFSKVVFLIDEVSSSPVARERTAKFAQDISAFDTSNCPRDFSVLTIVFVQPQDADKLDTHNGPRGNLPFDLGDFSPSEVEAVLHKGMKAVNSGAPGQSAVEADVAGVTACVYTHTGGIPTLTLGLLHDAYKRMVTRVNSSSAPPKLTKDDVEAVCRDPQGGQLAERLALFRFKIKLDASDAHRSQARDLLNMLSSGSIGEGPWEAEEFISQIGKKLGSTLKDEVILPVMRQLEQDGIITRESEKVRFRGQALRRYLSHAKVEA